MKNVMKIFIFGVMSLYLVSCAAKVEMLKRASQIDQKILIDNRPHHLGDQKIKYFALDNAEGIELNIFFHIREVGKKNYIELKVKHLHTIPNVDNKSLGRSELFLNEKKVDILNRYATGQNDKKIYFMKIPVKNKYLSPGQNKLTIKIMSPWKDGNYDDYEIYSIVLLQEF